MKQKPVTYFVTFSLLNIVSFQEKRKRNGTRLPPERLRVVSQVIERLQT